MTKSVKTIMGGDDIKCMEAEVIQWANKTVRYMEEREYRSAIQSYEDIQLYMGRRLLDNTRNGFGWSSNEKYPLIANAWKTYSGMMSRLDLNKVVVSSYMPTFDEEVKKGIPVYKSLVKYFLNKPETKAAITQIIDEALAVGTAYGRVSWKKNVKRIVKGVSGKGSKKKVTYETIEWGYPTITYCPYFSVVRDLTDNGRYTGERYYATKEQLKKEYGIDEKKFEEIDKENSIFQYDYNKVKNISSWDADIKQRCNDIINLQCQGKEGWRSLSRKLPKHDNWYTLDKNDLYEVFDVYIDGYEETYNIVLVNGVIVYSGESQNPFPGSPIIQLDFEKMPGEVFGRGIGWMGRGYQSSVDTLYNSYLNSIKILTNPHFTQEETLTGTNSKTFNYTPWGITPKSSGAYTLEKLVLVNGEDTRNNLEAIQIIENKFAADLGLNPYVTGQAGGIERSAEGVNQRKLGTDNKIAKFLDNINTFFSKAVENMTLLQIVFGDDVFEEMEGERVEFANKDIITGYRITFDGEAILGEKSSKTQSAINLLSAIAPFNRDEVTGEPIVDSRALLKTVFDNLDMYNMVKSDDEKLKGLRTDVDYMKQKQEILSAMQGPTDPFDKQNMSITISGKDLMDIPEAREKILKSIGIDIATQQQQMQEQASVEVATTPKQPEQIGRPQLFV